MRCGKYREGVILNESRMKMAVFMEDRKIQLTEWEGPDGCISTKRVAVEKDAGRLLLSHETRRRMGQRLALHGRR